MENKTEQKNIGKYIIISTIVVLVIIFAIIGIASENGNTYSSSSSYKSSGSSYSGGSSGSSYSGSSSYKSSGGSSSSKSTKDELKSIVQQEHPWWK